MMDWSRSLTLNKTEDSDTTVEIEIPFDLLQYLSTEGSCIQNLCRICMLVQQNKSCLFSSSNPALHEMLSAISSVRAQVDDGLPSQICELCEAEIISCYRFKEKCEKSEFTLKSLLKGEFLTVEMKSMPKEEISQYNDEISDKLGKCTDKSTIYLIENNEHSEYTKNRKDNDNTALTQGMEPREDIQYLEPDEISCTEALYAVKEDSRDKKQKKRFISGTKPGKVLTDKNESCLDNDQSCEHCSKKFKNQKALLTHMKKFHGSDGQAQWFSCAQCKEVFNSDHDLSVHSALHDRTHSAWRCNKCSKEFKARSLLRRHIYRHMESKRFSCEECGKAFVELYALRRHTRVHTGEQREKKHVCHLCNKRYSESSLLSAHLSAHSGEKPWRCAECGKQFASARLLGSHRAVHSARKPYACNYCDRRFRHESTRNTHHRTHTGERPYVCAACGKAFIQNSNLRLHMRTHTGERPYECQCCSRRFTSGSSLKNHARTHTDEDKVACHLCTKTGKKYSRTNLKAHMRLHAGPRPFACSVCSKRFLTAARLRNHHRMHTGEKPFECSICTQPFSTKSQLRQHLKQHEKEEQKRNKKLAVQNTQKKDTEPTIEIVNYTVEDQAPLEAGEIVVQAENEEQTEILVVDNSEIEVGLQSGNICLEGVTYVQNDNINLVAVNDGVNISSTSATLQGSTVNLYQIDQSLVQIHSTGAQVTISKITSKMTTNFQ